MKILAMEKEIPGARAGQFESYRKEEARRVWALYKQGIVREMHFRQDRHEAILLFECADPGEARRVLDTLPLVEKGPIDFDIIPLVPYPGFERLFETDPSAAKRECIPPG
jgi:muconolactone delta-isomerase